MKKIKLMNMYMYVLCVILCNSVIIQFIEPLLVLTYLCLWQIMCAHIITKKSARAKITLKGGRVGGGEG